jgi:hypothetical protein
MAAYWRARKEFGYETAVERGPAISEQIDVLGKRIRELRATTLEGFAVKATYGR